MFVGLRLDHCSFRCPGLQQDTPLGTIQALKSRLETGGRGVPGPQIPFRRAKPRSRLAIARMQVLHPRINLGEGWGSLSSGTLDEVSNS